MTRTPWPAAVASTPHTWVPVTCADCGVVVGSVASFDSTRLPDALYCGACHGWQAVRCTRCNRPVGATRGAMHDAPLVYCVGCVMRDEAAQSRVVSGGPPVADVKPEEDPW